MRTRASGHQRVKCLHTCRNESQISVWASVVNGAAGGFSFMFLMLLETVVTIPPKLLMNCFRMTVSAPHCFLNLL